MGERRPFLTMSRYIRLTMTETVLLSTNDIVGPSLSTSLMVQSVGALALMENVTGSRPGPPLTLISTIHLVLVRVRSLILPTNPPTQRPLSNRERQKEK